jgi:hypothetical protein
MRFRKPFVVVAALALAGAAALAYAQAANVSSKFVGGDLIFYDKAGNALLQYDGTNRKIIVPSGSVLDLDAATGAVTFAAGEIVAADLATDSVDSAEIATSAVATAEILDGTIANIDISASAAIARSKLAEDALQAYPVTLLSSAGAALLGTETAGTFNFNVATNVVTIKGEVTDNETETSVAWFQFVLPPSYVAAGDVSVRLRSELLKSNAPTDNASSIDVACFEQADGAVGADLSTTTAASGWAALDTWETDTFVITATGLVAGDILNCSITAAVTDSEAGAGTITLTMDPPKVLLDVKG